jgi:phosphoribosylformimino-5-aminoimidazole carboxamide ribotide isomerase
MTQADARKLEGAIAGRALYDGRLDPAAALKMLRSPREEPQAAERRAT